jgi:hypothetical protein
LKTLDRVRLNTMVTPTGPRLAAAWLAMPFGPHILAPTRAIGMALLDSSLARGAAR